MKAGQANGRGSDGGDGWVRQACLLESPPVTRVQRAMTHLPTPWATPSPVCDPAHDTAVTDAEGERFHRLTEARTQLERVLLTLDEWSQSPAPASVDMAIHQINRELGV